MYDKFRTNTRREIDPQNPSPAEWGTMFHTLLSQHYLGEPFQPTGNALLDARFQEYKRYYQDEFVEVMAVESKVEKVLTPQISLIGTADLVTKTGIWDHKTSSSLRSEDELKFGNSDQFLHYLYINGFEHGEVTINQISSSANPGARERDPAKAAKMKFNRFTFAVDEWRIEDWLKRTTAVAHEIVRTIEAADAYLFKSTSACGDFGVCYYISQCTHGMYTPDAFNSLTDDHFSITLEP
jgi:hypothetical protein